MVEVLGRMVSNRRNAKRIQGLKPSSNNVIVSHHQFVDDTILIGKASMWEARNFKDVLVLYGQASHQKVNFQKIKIFFFNTPIEWHKKITKLFQCQISELPSVYLGMPLFVGGIIKSFWDSIVEMIKMKLVGWKEAILSHVGKL